MPRTARSTSPHCPLIPDRRVARQLLPLGAWATAAVLSACGGGGSSGSTSPTPPPPEVGVVTTSTATADLVTELPGRLEPYRIAQVRARVAGILDKRHFTEGSDVKAGQALFSIDAAPYRAALDSAKASLQKAEATLLQAQGLAERYTALAPTQAVSQQEALAAQAAAQQARADVAAGKAAVQAAQINLGYAHVTAPIAGRIGRSLVTEGALVGQGEATPLAVVQQIDPIYVTFTQSAAEVMRMREALAQGKLQRAESAGKAASVELLLDDGRTYPLKGKLLFSDLSVDPGTGQIQLRAELPNPKGQLLPGLYARVRLAQAQAEGIWLPEQAVAHGAKGDTVLVVSADDTATPRPVQLGPGRAGQALVLAGLKPGERVIVDGLQRAKPGGKVRTTPWSATGPASSAAPASAASK